MRILLVNDDGVEALGILALAERLKESHEVLLIAPDSERSAFSHSILSYTAGIRYKLIKEEQHLKIYACSGTPADCVKLGLMELCGQKPDMVLSGINRGVNLGMDLMYSGTVSAAVEGGYQGIPAVAVSTNKHYEAKVAEIAAFIADRLPDFIELLSDQKTCVLNINYPINVPVLGVRAAQISATSYGTALLPHPDVRDTYLLRGSRTEAEEAEDVDVKLFEKGYITISAVNILRDHVGMLQKVREKYAR